MNEHSSEGRALLEGYLELQRRLVQNLSKQALASGLTVGQLAIVRDVGDHPGTSLQEVCGRLGSPKSTVSRLVDDLVRGGQLVRQIPEEDRRSVRLFPNVGACLPFSWERLFPGLDLDDPAALHAALASLEQLKRTLGS